MKTGFESVPTLQLAQETTQKAGDLDDVTDAAWDTCGWALVGVAVGVLAGACVNIFYDWPLSWSLLLIPAVSLWPLVRWNAAIRRCDNFTRDMDSRRLELESRNSPDAKTEGETP